MTFTEDLANLITSSGKKPFTIGIVGLPYAGKDVLARSLVDELVSRGITAEHFGTDNYYIEMAPGMRIRRGNLAHDIKEFKAGARIFIGNSPVAPDTTVLVLTATLSFLAENQQAYTAFDFRVFSTFEDGKVRLDRKLRAEGPSGLRKTEGEILGEFTQEQIQAHAAIDMARQADVIWYDDTQIAKRVARRSSSLFQD